MSTRLVALRLLGGWFLLVLFLHSACATGGPPAHLERAASTAKPGLESGTEYELGVLEPGAVSTTRFSPGPHRI